MKIKTPTIILVALAAVLGIVVVAEVQKDGTSGGSEGEASQLFDFEENEIQALSVETNGETVAFERNSNGDWQMVEPEPSSASGASVSYLLNLLVNGESDRTLEVATADLANFGLDQPSAAIRVELADQESHQLILGSTDFNGSFLYAQADPPDSAPAETNVLLVSPDFETAVSRPLSEWQQQPGEEPSGTSPSPSPEATPESSTPSPEPSSSEPSTTP